MEKKIETAVMKGVEVLELVRLSFDLRLGKSTSKIPSYPNFRLHDPVTK